ncbi:MAG: aminotransferase class V-fold PLP-dependent enzyme [Myxococcales bacterium]|nr:aminotransferase class V-fold PLP-dependent enzyme [Myxococcales bacterium]
MYLDCNATTPLEPEVLEAMSPYFLGAPGNPSSSDHRHGKRAAGAVAAASAAIAQLVGTSAELVIFTSGATEANNLAILGLAAHAEKTGRRHIISTELEHKAVLEPLRHLRSRGFDVELLQPTAGGWIDPAALARSLRPETCLVSIMQVNNETGVRQPLEQVADVMAGHDAYLHVDAAQGFGKDLAPLRHPRIDLMSISGHKIFGPMGIGALISKRRPGGQAPPLSPLTFGGGQQRGLRPGTLPVPLIVGLGKAAELAGRDAEERAASCRAFRERALEALSPLRPVVLGDPARSLPHVLCVAFPGVTSPRLASALAAHISVSRGAACTDGTHEAFSHVLLAMGLPDEQLQGAIRLSWCHRTPQPDWRGVVQVVQRLRGKVPDCFACRVGY